MNKLYFDKSNLNKATVFPFRQKFTSHYPLSQIFNILKDTIITVTISTNIFTSDFNFSI